jgi:hypothetical protein
MTENKKYTEIAPKPLIWREGKKTRYLEPENIKIYQDIACITCIDGEYVEAFMNDLSFLNLQSI